MADLRKGMSVYDRTGLKLGELEGAIADAEKKQVTHLVMRAPVPLMEGRRLVQVDLVDFIIRSDVYLSVSVDARPQARGGKGRGPRRRPHDRGREPVGAAVAAPTAEAQTVEGAPAEAQKPKRQRAKRQKSGAAKVEAEKVA